jgi:Rrf2 family iron-sulfur cluster assembly transcriptional regulator
MKLSTQEEYGLRCLLQLGRQGDDTSLTIAELSQREGISAPNVAKIMRVLRKAGLVKSTRGQAGKPSPPSARASSTRASASGIRASAPSA